MNKITVFVILTIIMIFVIIFEFFYLTPIGIDIGYRLNGGSKEQNNDTNNEESLYREYKESLCIYNIYKNSSNFTANEWAEEAKERANQAAKKYNEITGNNTLKIIGD